MDYICKKNCFSKVNRFFVLLENRKKIRMIFLDFLLEWKIIFEKNHDMKNAFSEKCGDFHITNFLAVDD